MDGLEKQTEISLHNITSLCTIIMDGLEKQTEISLHNITLPADFTKRVPLHTSLHRSLIACTYVITI